jgi:formiminotetrahydrofolate cyclodeaminase
VYCDKSLKKYLDDLAAKIPAPGGGSAAALSAALGISLVSMVVNFTLGKPRYVEFEGELKKILADAEKLRSEFLRLVDLDVSAYQSRDLRDALSVPFMVARLCFAGIMLCPPLIKRSNPNLISDVACAAILLEAGFSAACFNVRVNLSLLADKQLSVKITKELQAKEKAVKKIRAAMEVKVGQIIGR